jgi:hypothetical protein
VRGEAPQADRQPGWFIDSPAAGAQVLDDAVEAFLTAIA